MYSHPIFRITTFPTSSMIDHTYDLTSSLD